MNPSLLPLPGLRFTLLLAAWVSSSLVHAGEWPADLEAARRKVVEVQDAKQRQAAAESAWQQLALDHPMKADWVLQDIGREAAALVDPSLAPAAEKRLLQAAGADPQAGIADWRPYFGPREERRRQRLSRVISQWGALAFTEGHTCDTSFIGYTEGLSDARAERFFKPGSRLSVLEFPADSTVGKIRRLIEDPRGMLRDAEVSFDRKRLLFAWKKSDRLDDYHIYEYDLAKWATRQLTFGLGRADYEPMQLPDGDIIFTSTRPEQSVPCWWTEISNLYRMDADGRGIRRLAIDQVHALYPQLLTDGRLTYTRWDYNDRGQNFPHPLFVMRPDGKDQRAYYGGNSWFPTSLLHSRGIPGTSKVMSIASGHHTRQHGKLVVIDPDEGRDEGKGMHFISPVREVPYERVDRAMQGGDQFRYPYPISEDELFVSYRPDWGVSRFGLYWMNAAGERELLYHGPDLEVARMVPLGHRPAVATLADEVDSSKKTGNYYVHDVYQGTGLEGIPRGEAKTIRVVRLNYRAAGVGMTHNAGEGGGSINSSPVGLSNTSWDVKEILGDADIHPDGSALFEVPAMESIYLQVLDARGRVIQTTRSWDTLRPGETKGCAGCHDKSNGNFHPYRPEQTDAWRHGVQKLRPFHGGVRGFSFPKEIQPILDSKCVSCHDGATPGAPDLRSLPERDGGLTKRVWTKSYVNLLGAKLDVHKNHVTVPHEGVVRWISKMSKPTEIPPYHAGAARSPLIRLLDEGHHGVKLTAEENDKLSAWIDLLVPFCGDYREGNAWSGREMAYYGYYETKRAWQKEEETLETAAHETRRQGKPMPPAQAPHTFMRAAYRDVLQSLQLVRRDDGSQVLPDHEAALIDLISFESPEGPVLLEIRDLRDRRLIAEIRTSGTSTASVYHFAEPMRSDRIAITTPGTNVPVRLARAQGVSVSEVPVVGGFHPFLEKHLR